MVAWFNDNLDCDSGSELWGETKAADDYSLGDLKDWLDKKDMVKGKKPATTGSNTKKERRTRK